MGGDLATREIIEQLSRVNRTDISEAGITAFKHEDDFTGKLIELLIEAGSFITICTQIFPSGEGGWTRNEAVVGGLLVRLYKLVHNILDQTCQHRRETTFIAGRLHFETAVNLLFITQRADEEVIQDFILSSLRHEVRLLERIRANVSARGDELWPIEERMISSIVQTFSRASTSEQEVRDHERGPWSRLTLYDRSQVVGLDGMYLGVFGGGSSIVHGNWGDLQQHHLRPKGDRFFPELEFRPIRPQILESTCMLTMMAALKSIEFYGLVQSLEKIQELSDDYASRLRLLSDAHEAFLQRN